MLTGRILLSTAVAGMRRANIKVSSTETGAIFGNIVYEATGYSDRSVVRVILSRSVTAVSWTSCAA